MCLLTVVNMCACECGWERVGKLSVPWNLTPINLSDGLIIIPKCRCGDLKLGSLLVPVISCGVSRLKRWWSHFDIVLFHQYNWWLQQKDAYRGYLIRQRRSSTSRPALHLSDPVQSLSLQPVDICCQPGEPCLCSCCSRKRGGARPGFSGDPEGKNVNVSRSFVFFA